MYTIDWFNQGFLLPPLLHRYCPAVQQLPSAPLTCNTTHSITQQCLRHINVKTGSVRGFGGDSAYLGSRDNIGMKATLRDS